MLYSKYQCLYVYILIEMSRLHQEMPDLPLETKKQNYTINLYHRYMVDLHQYNTNISNKTSNSSFCNHPFMFPLCATHFLHYQENDKNWLFRFLIMFLHSFPLPQIKNKTKLNNEEIFSSTLCPSAWLGICTIPNSFLAKQR